MENGEIVSLAGGTAIAFVAAVVAVFSDLQQNVKDELKTADTSVLAVWQGWAILGAWGIVVAAMYLVILNHKDWAAHAFGFNVDDNRILAGLAVGLSAVLIIRSKLAKVGNVELGGEYAYLWSRAYLLKSVNGFRRDRRIAAINRYNPVVTDLANYPDFFTKLEEWMRETARGTPEVATRMVGQIEQIKAQAGPNPPNANVDSRRFLVGLAIDSFSAASLDRFAQTNGISV